MIAAGEPKRRLVRLSPAGDEVNASEARRRHRRQLARQLLLRRVGKSLVVHERERLRVRTGGLDQVLAPVTERERHRPASHRVEVAAALGILNPHAVPLDDHRVTATELGVQHPGAHNGLSSATP